MPEWDWRLSTPPTPPSLSLAVNKVCLFTFDTAAWGHREDSALSQSGAGGLKSPVMTWVVVLPLGPGITSQQAASVSWCRVRDNASGVTVIPGQGTPGSVMPGSVMPAVCVAWSHCSLGRKGLSCGAPSGAPAPSTAVLVYHWRLSGRCPSPPSGVHVNLARGRVMGSPPS